MMRANLNLQSRIMLVFAPILIVGVAITSSTLLILNRIDSIADGIIFGDEGSQQALVAYINLQRMLITNFDYYLLQGQGSVIYHEAFEEHLSNFITETTILGQLSAITDRQVLDALQLDAANDAYQEAWENLVISIDEGNEENAIEDLYILVDQSNTMGDLIEDEFEAYASQLDVAKSRASSWFFSLYLINGATLFLFVGLSIGTGIMLNRQVTMPLMKIRDAVIHAKEDRFDASFLEGISERKDEIGFLARAIIRMYEHVNGVENAYEAEIAELTQKISNLRSSSQ